VRQRERERERGKRENTQLTLALEAFQLRIALRGDDAPFVRAPQPRGPRGDDGGRHQVGLGEHEERAPPPEALQVGDERGRQMQRRTARVEQHAAGRERGGRREKP
jgi:hypothetical protein